MAFTIVALLLVLIVVFVVRASATTRKKERPREFFDALVAGDTDKAYALWKPTSSYKKGDFLADWGTAGYYGPVKSYKIMGAKAPRKSESIAVNVAISPYSPFPDLPTRIRAAKPE